MLSSPIFIAPRNTKPEAESLWVNHIRVFERAVITSDKSPDQRNCDSVLYGQEQGSPHLMRVNIITVRVEVTL
jgi:hypothetical protein